MAEIKQTVVVLIALDITSSPESDNQKSNILGNQTYVQLEKKKRRKLLYV